MRILLSSIYHISSYTGGNEQYLHHLALGLTKLNHQVYYLTGQAQNVSNYPYTIITRPVPHFMGKPFITSSWINEFKKVGPDIFHASGSGLALLALAIYGKKLKIPSILTYQGDSHCEHVLLKLLSMIEHQLIFNSFNTIITTTPYYQKKLLRQWPLKNIHFVPMMINPIIVNNKLSKSQSREKILWKDNKLILFIGALSSHQYYKGIDVLINASKYLPMGYQICIIGSGDKQQFYQQQVLDMKLQSKVKFLGYLQDLETTIYLKAADVLVLPSTSDSEGFGLVLIEAMASCTPTITTNIIGSAQWFVKERVSRLINPNKPKELADAILKVIDQPDKSQIDRAYNFSKEFSVSAMTEKTLKIYQQLTQHES